MIRSVYAARAEADFRDIYRYTLKNWGHAQARAYAAKLRAACETAHDAPAARPIPGRADGAMRLGCGRHVIVFRREGDMILHERMDLSAHLDTGP